MKCTPKNIPRQLDREIEVFKKTNQSHKVTGYFLMETIEGSDGRSNGVISVYDTEDYINLLGFLETFVLELKTRLMINYTTDSKLSESQIDEILDERQEAADDLKDDLTTSERESLESQLLKGLNTIIKKAH